MPEPRPNLGSFINFANASDRRRSTVLSTIRQQSTAEYSPATDYWKRMRDAVKRDRATTRDGAAVFATASNATEKKQDAFREIAMRWQALLPRWQDSAYEAPRPGLANVWGLEVSVTPRFIEVFPSHLRERTFVYFNATKLVTETIDDVLRVIQLAYPGDTASTATLIDVRRNAVHQGLTEPVDVVDARLDILAQEFLGAWAA